MDYITLYLPTDSRMFLLGQHGHQLSHEVTDWLVSNVGDRAPTNHLWFLNLINQKYQWSYSGLVHDDSGDLVRSFYFRNQTQALLFKMTWGGQ